MFHSDIILYYISIKSERHEEFFGFRIDYFVSVEILGEFLLNEGFEFFESFVLLLFFDDRVFIGRSVFIMFVRGSYEFAVFCSR